jgi:hypothetical protein
MKIRLINRCVYETLEPNEIDKLRSAFDWKSDENWQVKQTISHRPYSGLITVTTTITGKIDKLDNVQRYLSDCFEVTLWA